MASIHTHTNIIRDAKTLITDISKSTDSIERSLPRTKDRIGVLESAAAATIAGATTAAAAEGSFVAPSMIYLAVGEVFALSYICLADLWRDRDKLREINTKLIELDNAKLDKARPDYDKAVLARDFQKKVYIKIGDYTLTAQTIKKVTSCGAFLFWLGTFIALSRSQYPRVESPNLDLAIELAIKAGLLIALPNALCGLYHWMIEGAKLNRSNQELAQQTSKELTV